MEKGQEHVESFLDHGWSVIGRFHRWLTTCQPGPWDHSELVDLIRGLQLMWSSSEDLGLTRIVYSCLTLEQLLERFCARTLEMRADHFVDITAGVELLQDLLLGFEATREEPKNFSLEVMLRLHRHAKEPASVNNDPKALEPQLVAGALPDSPRAPESSEESLPCFASDAETVATNSQDLPAAAQADKSHALLDQVSVESTVLAMLKQFIDKLDDTCHRLHERMVADAAPYVTTTTRLVHLVQVTRELVLQLADKKDSMTATPPESSSPEVAKIGSLSLDDTVISERSVVDAEIIQSPPEQNVGERIPAILQSGFAEPDLRLRRILIVEESSFYRQMISMAVRTMGFEPVTVDSSKAGVEILKPPCDYCAVLVDAEISPAMAETLRACRHDDGMKVIGMTSSISKGCLTFDFDDQVARSNPRQLREILNRLLDSNINVTRRSA